MEHIRKGKENDKKAIALCVVQAFENHLSLLSKDEGKLAAAFSDGFKADKFYVLEQDGEIKACLAITDNRGRAFNAKFKSLLREFGFIRAFIAYLALQNEYGKKLEYSDDTGFVEMVAVLKNERRKGYASSLIKEAVELAPYKRFTLDVTDINTAAIELYSKLGFKETHRKAEKHAKQKGFNARVFMEYNKSFTWNI